MALADPRRRLQTEDTPVQMSIIKSENMSSPNEGFETPEMCVARRDLNLMLEAQKPAEVIVQPVGVNKEVHLHNMRNLTLEKYNGAQKDAQEQIRLAIDAQQGVSNQNDQGQLNILVQQHNQYIINLKQEANGYSTKLMAVHQCKFEAMQHQRLNYYENAMVVAAQAAERGQQTIQQCLIEGQRTNQEIGRLQQAVLGQQQILLAAGQHINIQA